MAESSAALRGQFSGAADQTFRRVRVFFQTDTLAELWPIHGSPIFSRFGNLQETVIQLVDQSIVGKTHEELERQLRLRVHNTLLDLVRSGKLTRELCEGVFVYLSMRADLAAQQLTGRREGTGDSAQDIVPDGIVIEVLAEIIRTGRVQIDQDAILTRLAARGIGISASQLNRLCTRLDLKKTPGFGS